MTHTKIHYVSGRFDSDPDIYTVAMSETDDILDIDDEIYYSGITHDDILGHISSCVPIEGFLPLWIEYTRDYSEVLS